jgi:hypothetical protein
LRTVAIVVAVVIAATGGSGQAVERHGALPTMGEVLAHCDSDQDADKKKCDLDTNAIFMTTYDAAGGPEQDPKHPLCLPDGDNIREVERTFQRKLLDWIRSHPKEQSLSEAEGLRPFVFDTFTCS